LRLPKFGSAFRVTHRFTRPLGSGDFGDLAADFFGMDTGAQIGLEYRFGIIPSGQIGILRTSDREIEFFAEYGVFRQGPGRPFEVVALASDRGWRQFQGRQVAGARRGRVATRGRLRGLLRRANLGEQLEPAFPSKSSITTIRS
jgi:hypothetical protein